MFVIPYFNYIVAYCRLFFLLLMLIEGNVLFFFFSSRRRHTRWPRDWSSDVCSSDLRAPLSQAPHGKQYDRLQESKDRHGLAPVHNRRARTLDRVQQPGSAVVFPVGHARKCAGWPRPRTVSWLGRNDRTQQGRSWEAVQSRLSPPVTALPEAGRQLLWQYRFGSQIRHQVV